MSLGSTPRQGDIFRSTTEFCAPRIAPESIYALLHRECFGLFPDALFGDLFTDIGRRSIPPLIVAVVMVLQRLEGCSDREAVERFSFDARWKYAAGGLPFDHPGFAHTVLVDMRARLARSDRPNRIFEVTLEVARGAGLVGVRRVLDSTPLYDAVATMDTVTLVRSAIRRLLALADAREEALRSHLRRDDDYRAAGRPAADYDDRAAREALVDALARDGRALLAALDGERLPALLAEAAALLATVLGQDLDEGTDGVFRIARRVARDRIISTVDPDARHGHKTSAHGFEPLQGPHRDRSRRRAHHPDKGERRQRRRCRRGTRTARRRACRHAPRDSGGSDPRSGRWRRSGSRSGAAHRLRGRRLRRGRAARHARGSRGDEPLQGPATGRAGRPLFQGRLHDRPAGPDRHLSGRPARAAPERRPGRDRLVRSGLCGLSARRPLHGLAEGPDDRGRTV